MYIVWFVSAGPDFGQPLPATSPPPPYQVTPGPGAPPYPTAPQAPYPPYPAAGAPYPPSASPVPPYPYQWSGKSFYGLLESLQFSLDYQFFFPFLFGFMPLVLRQRLCVSNCITLYYWYSATIFVPGNGSPTAINVVLVVLVLVLVLVLVVLVLVLVLVLVVLVVGVLVVGVLVVGVLVVQIFNVLKLFHFSTDRN